MNQYITNPFQFEGAVTGGKFCGRTDDINALLEYMRSGSNVVISMKRRVGKTSVIQEVFKNHISKENIVVGYVDIYPITSVKEFYAAIKEEVQEIIGISKGLGIAASEISNAFKDAKISIGIEKNPKINIEFMGNDYFILIKKLFESLQEFALKNQMKFVFAIDEFQKIATLRKKDTQKLEAIIRTAMQNTTHISFIMSGSNQTMLDAMFKENRPLYRQGVHYYLEPIEECEFYNWVSKKFKQKEITIDRKAFNYVYELANTEAKIIQQFCFELFWRTEALNNIELEEVCKIAIKIYKRNTEIATKFNNLTLNEQKMLKIISLEKEHGITVSPLLQEYDLNHGSVSNLLASMVNKYIIIKKEGIGKYEIVDTELKLWILVSKQRLCV